MKNLDQKIAVITGAGSGIGRALACQLAEAGCHLALSDVDMDGLGETANMLALQPGRKLSQHRVDVGKREDIEQWAAAVKAEHGGANLLINNAGVALSGTVAELSVEDYAWIMDINFWGTIWGTKAFLPMLQDSGEGHIVNLSSVFGLCSQPLMSGYNASKFAVRGFSESLRQELDMDGGRVSLTCVHPGGIKTNVAKSARMSDSTGDLLGTDNNSVTAEFERSFITSADSAARTIIKAVRRNRRRVLVGPDARLYDWMVRLLPTAHQRLVTMVVSWRGRALKKAAQ